MKKYNSKSQIVLVALLMTPLLGVYAQEQNLIAELENWKGIAINVFNSIVGVAAVAGAFWVYTKMNTDEGGSGKKALITYLGALMFAVLAIFIINTFIG